jgi:TRAP-type mannitol/chloroaromatic compound transport system permease small subunit
LKLLIICGNAITTINRCVSKFAALLIYPLIAIFIIDVVKRYFLNGATNWAIEAVWMVCGSMVFLGGAYCLHEGGHVRADILYRKLPPKIKPVLDIIGYVALYFPAMIFLATSTWRFMVDSYIRHETSAATSWMPILWPFKLILLISVILLILQGVVELARSMSVWFGKEVKE